MKGTSLRHHSLLGVNCLLVGTFCYGDCVFCVVNLRLNRIANHFSSSRTGILKYNYRYYSICQWPSHILIKRYLSNVQNNDQNSYHSTCIYSPFSFSLLTFFRCHLHSHEHSVAGIQFISSALRRSAVILYRISFLLPIPSPF